MSLFVNNIEVDEVFVNGVEADSVFANGVQVYSAAPPGDPMFDDMNRSANGTPITSHLMNTGQSWLRATNDTNSTIQTRQSSQVCTSPTSGTFTSVQTDIVPVPAVLAPAYQCNVNWGSQFPAPIVRFVYIYVQDGGGSTIAAAVMSTAFNNGYCFIQIDGGATQGDSPTLTTVDDVSGLFEAWWDGTFLQCRATFASGTVTSGKIAIPSRPTILRNRIYVQSVNVGNTAQAMIKTYELIPFDPANVPFP